MIGWHKSLLSLGKRRLDMGAVRIKYTWFHELALHRLNCAPQQFVTITLDIVTCVRWAVNCVQVLLRLDADGNSLGLAL